MAAGGQAGDDEGEVGGVREEVDLVANLTRFLQVRRVWWKIKIHNSVADDPREYQGGAGQVV